jgi:hypothetical protein
MDHSVLTVRVPVKNVTLLDMIVWNANLAIIYKDLHVFRIAQTIITYTMDSVSPPVPIIQRHIMVCALRTLHRIRKWFLHRRQHQCHSLSLRL